MELRKEMIPIVFYSQMINKNATNVWPTTTSLLVTVVPRKNIGTKLQNHVKALQRIKEFQIVYNGLIMILKLSALNVKLLL